MIKPHAAKLSRRQFIVELVSGAETGWLSADSLITSGMDEATFTTTARERAAHAVHEACERLPNEIRQALSTIRTRVEQDRLPLLSMLQANPLHMQSSHLSFQEYFAACSICEGRRLAGSPPWQWTVWWANALRLGIEMGDSVSALRAVHPLFLRASLLPFPLSAHASATPVPTRLAAIGDG